MVFLTVATFAGLIFAFVLGIAFELTALVVAVLISCVVGAALHQIGRPATSITPAADHWTRRPTHVNPVWAARLTSTPAVVAGIVLIFAVLVGVNALLH